ncbi:MAG: polysaccharide deacetylase family protein [Cytophagales bacterium]|nr:polysaccharide deacetylase family protein [Cytophagales bacterium]
MNIKVFVFHILSVAILGGNQIQEPDQLEQTDLCAQYTCIYGGLVRGDTTKKELAIVFTGGDFADGGMHIAKILRSNDVKASFFFTGDFYRNPQFSEIIQNLVHDKHYLGAHSDKHLLYCDWTKRDSLFVSRDEFISDLEANYREMEKFGIMKNKARLFMPPYEWYNDSISYWTREAGFQLVNFTEGVRTNADYTTPEMSSYVSSDEIWKSIIDYESGSGYGLNGFIMLIHIGTAPERKDKFYFRLEELIHWLTLEGYGFKRIDELILME